MNFQINHNIDDPQNRIQTQMKEKEKGESVSEESMCSDVAGFFYR